MVAPAIRAMAYVGIGVTGEVIYTAIKALIQKKDLRLQGYTQMWVMPFYALGGLFLFERFYLLIHPLNILFRFCLYALLIFAVEYVAGFIGKLITGKCPWEYLGKWSIHGYIDLPHFPFWGAAGLVFEVVYRYLMSL